MASTRHQLMDMLEPIMTAGLWHIDHARTGTAHTCFEHCLYGAVPTECSGTAPGDTVPPQPGRDATAVLLQ
jgi:hypothetical protein